MKRAVMVAVTALLVLLPGVTSAATAGPAHLSLICDPPGVHHGGCTAFGLNFVPKGKVTLTFIRSSNRGRGSKTYRATVKADGGGNFSHRQYFSLPKGYFMELMAREGSTSASISISSAGIVVLHMLCSSTMGGRFGCALSGTGFAANQTVLVTYNGEFGHVGHGSQRVDNSSRAHADKQGRFAQELSWYPATPCFLLAAHVSAYAGPSLAELTSSSGTVVSPDFHCR